MATTAFVRHRQRWVAALEGMDGIAALKQRALIDAIDAEHLRRREQRARLRESVAAELQRAEQHPNSSAAYLKVLRGLPGLRGIQSS